MASTGTPIAASSAAMLARLITDMYSSVVAFGLRRASAKACPCDRDDAQRSLHRVAEEIGKEFCDQPASLRFAHLRAQHYSIVFGDRQDATFKVDAGPQLRQLFVAH